MILLAESATENDCMNINNSVGSLSNTTVGSNKIRIDSTRLNGKLTVIEQELCCHWETAQSRVNFNM